MKLLRVPLLLAAALITGATASPLAAHTPAPHAGATRQGVTLPDTGAITAGMIDAGRRIFHGAGGCFVCHGANLEGGAIAPPLRPHAWRDARDGAFPEIFRVVTHGVPGTMMVSHPGGISDAMAVTVAAYIWAVSHRGVKP